MKANLTFGMAVFYKKGIHDTTPYPLHLKRLSQNFTPDKASGTQMVSSGKLRTPPPTTGLESTGMMIVQNNLRLTSQSDMFLLETHQKGAATVLKGFIHVYHHETRGQRPKSIYRKWRG